MAVLVAGIAMPANAGVWDALSDFQKPNMKLGQMGLHPYYRLSEMYDSNIFLQPRSKVAGQNANGNAAGPVLGSWITANNLGVKADLPISDMHKIDMGYDFVWKAYSKDPHTNNTVNQMADLGYAYSGPMGLSGKLKENYLNTVDQATNELTGRLRRWQNTLGASMEYGPEGGNLFAGVDLGQVNHKYVANDPAVRGALNRYEQSFGLKTGYRLQPKTRAYLSYGRQIIHYSVPQASPKHNKSHLFGVGLEGEITPQLMGQIETGMQYRKYDNPPTGASRTTTRNWTVGTRLKYKPTDMTRVDVALTRSLQESTFANSQYYVATGANVGVSHQLPYKLTAGVNAGVEIDKYSESTTLGGLTASRRDDVYQVGTSLDYDIQEWLKTGISYLYRARFSRFTEQFNYKDHQTAASVSLLF
ncbi:MAG: outer membrane beta-barrel protein [Elusimicrobia bacterium]|nr:outer membrane beta-barrel protein [Elusimicrobiota bacterium]